MSLASKALERFTKVLGDPVDDDDYLNVDETFTIEEYRTVVHALKMLDATRNLVEIKQHEREAMLNCISVLRATAQELMKKDRPYAVTLLIWTQMVEDVVERMEAGNADRTAPR